MLFVNPQVSTLHFPYGHPTFSYLALGIIKSFMWVFHLTELYSSKISGLLFKNVAANLKKNLFYLWKEMVNCAGL